MHYSSFLSMSILIAYVPGPSASQTDHSAVLKDVSSAFARYGCENDQGVVENYVAVCTYAGGTPDPTFQQVVGPTRLLNEEKKATTLTLLFSAASMSPRLKLMLRAVEATVAL